MSNPCSIDTVGDSGAGVSSRADMILLCCIVFERCTRASTRHVPRGPSGPDFGQLLERSALNVKELRVPDGAAGDRVDGVQMAARDDPLLGEHLFRLVLR